MQYFVYKGGTTSFFEQDTGGGFLLNIKEKLLKKFPTKILFLQQYNIRMLTY